MEFAGYLFQGKTAKANAFYEFLYASLFGVAAGGVWKTWHW